ncbi:GrpB family protein [Dactylosporangium sp. NPDC051541]|uniref:GrpB family protein n=1 Tax=Dactylosporangium sp. NPDC051541 TaxID=3363977 RepID=UPI0037B1FC50
MVIHIDEYDPAWPAQARAVIAELQAAHPALFKAVEHVGSTAIPGLPAKPVIDLMTAVDTLEAVPATLGQGFTLIETGMPDRYFYRRDPTPPTSTNAPDPADPPTAHPAEPDGARESEPGGARESEPGGAREISAGGGWELPVHLHVVTWASWETRNERLLRDFLLRHADERAEYGRLKQRLAAAGLDGDGYTRGKTALIQRLVDAARDERGLPRVPVWEE